MSLPTAFANLTTATGAELDGNFAALGALCGIPCNASGTNSITLTPVSNTPTVTTYANYLLCSFVAAANSTGAVTVNVAGQGAVPLYLSSGSQAAAGSLSANSLYLIAYNSALDSEGGGFVILNATSATALPGGLLAVTYFTSTSTWTKQAGTNSIFVQVQAAGGGSAGTGACTAANASCPGGGASGDYCELHQTSAIPGTAAVTIGAGGIAGIASGLSTNGGTGGNTSFGSLCIAQGGLGSLSGNTNVGTSQLFFPGGAASSGAADVGTLQVPGSPGLAGLRLSATVAMPGYGANSRFGGGGQTLANNAAGTRTAQPGNGYGSGASGPVSTSTAGSLVGAAGAPGLVIVWEFS